MNSLTHVSIRAYFPPVAETKATGIGVLMYAAMSRDSILQSGFFASGVSSMGGPGGRAAGLAGAYPVRQSRSAPPTPIGVVVRGSLNELEYASMTCIAHDASASTLFPSAFTTRESAVIKKALSIIEEKRLREAPVLYYFEDFQRYLVLRFAGLTNEQGHVLYLDINRRLLSAETEFFGHQSAVSWDMRKVVLRAITLGAEHVVFAHNHPTDNPTPSEGDLRHLKRSEDALRPLNINLLDSYVVTSRRITSIKDFRKQQEEEEQRRRMEEYQRRSDERGAKIRAGRARKAAERAAQLQGAAA